MPLQQTCKRTAWRKNVLWHAERFTEIITGIWQMARSPLPAILFKKNGASMLGTPFPSSSPLSIEPISMRVPDACRYTGISRSTLYLLIARGELEVVKMGAATLVLTESLRQLIERRRCSSPNPKPQLTQVASARHGQTMPGNAD